MARTTHKDKRFLLNRKIKGLKMDAEIIELLEKLNNEKEPKRDSAVAEYIKTLLQKERG